MRISYLINAVTQTFQLLNSPSGLFVGIITCSNSTHTSRFVPSVTLCAIIKIRVGASRAISIKSTAIRRIVNTRGHIRHIHADISCHRNMWTSMGFAHDSNDRNLRKANTEMDKQNNFSSIQKKSKLTPLAVLIGLAFNLGNKAFL